MNASLAILGWLAALGAGLSSVAARQNAATRRELVTRACHELRGPITASRLGIEAGLRRGGLSLERMRALEAELDRATLAIDDLGAALERRSSRAERRPGQERAVHTAAAASIERVVRDSAEACQPLASANGVELRVSASSPAIVRGDRRRLSQAVGNLVANAIEHGGGVVDIRTRDDRDTIRLEVLDDGPGLPAPIAQLTRRARAGRGTRGRGLAIATAIAAQHGGRLSCAPSERGARMVLELPRWSGAWKAPSRQDWTDPAG